MSQPPGQHPDEQSQHGPPQYGPPQYGQPQYGQPQYGQPQYGQPQYGQPQYGGGGNYPSPLKQGNGYATAGIILAIFAPVLGLIFSIIGLVKSKARAGAGKGMSIAGIALSLVVCVVAGISLANIAQSTAADPGCIRAEDAAGQMNTTLDADGAAISRDAGNPSALRTDLRKTQTDLQSLQQQLSGAQGQAMHQVVTSRIGTLTSDVSTLSADLQAIENGDTSQASQMNALATKLRRDGDALDSTCSTL
jgi:hypothetical protein